MDLRHIKHSSLEQHIRTQRVEFLFDAIQHFGMRRGLAYKPYRHLTGRSWRFGSILVEVLSYNKFNIWNLSAAANGIEHEVNSLFEALEIASRFEPTIADFLADPKRTALFESNLLEEIEKCPNG